MKTAVSLPDEVFSKAEALARRMKLNRSQLYSRALAEFVARHAPDEVTETLDRLCEEIDDEARDDFQIVAARRTFERSPW